MPAFYLYSEVMFDEYIIKDSTDSIHIDKELYDIEVNVYGCYETGEIYQIVLDDTEVIAGKKLDALRLAIETFNKMQ